MQVEGITLEIMEAALRQAADGRRHILAQMQACAPPPRGELGPYTPRILVMTVSYACLAPFPRRRVHVLSLLHRGCVDMLFFHKCRVCAG